jgi:GTP pyrophosphokinase
VVAEFKAPDVENLLISVGYGKIRARQVVRRLEPERVPRQKPVGAIPFADATQRKALADSDSTIQIKGHDDLLVFRARCCNPIQGEAIVGYITLGRGISVHSRNCPNVENLLLNPERTLDVQWSDGVGEVRYPVRISISTEDRPGVLADITSAVSELKTNIVDAQARTVGSQYGEIEITVEVRDMGHLNKILHFLKGISGVHAVGRTRSGSGK